jgi:hypothetical protein
MAKCPGGCGGSGGAIIAGPFARRLAGRRVIVGVMKTAMRVVGVVVRRKGGVGPVEGFALGQSLGLHGDCPGRHLNRIMARAAQSSVACSGSRSIHRCAPAVKMSLPSLGVMSAALEPFGTNISWHILRRATTP